MKKEETLRHRLVWHRFVPLPLLTSRSCHPTARAKSYHLGGGGGGGGGGAENAAPL